MLLPRWIETLRQHRDRPAVFSDQGTLSFAELAAALDQQPPATGPVEISGDPATVAIATLRAWRDQQVAVPVEKPGTPLPPLEALPADAAHLKLTPGNEGLPRAIVFTATQLAADADRIVAAMQLDPAVPTLAAISLTHSYGYSSVILPLLLHGIPIQAVDVPFPAVVAAAWEKHERIHVPAVPSIWRAWNRSGILARAPGLLAVSAGAPLPLELEQAIWSDHRIKLHNFYGASECGGISYDATSLPRSSESDLGTPLPGVEVTLDDDGCFLVRSSSVATSYDIHRTTDRIAKGTFLTPDHGHLESGRLFLDSRGSTTINIAGRKIGPGRVESALTATGLVKRVRVFGLPSRDPDRVDEIAALLELRGSLAELKAAVSGTLAAWELPRHWITDPSGEDWSLTRSQLRESWRLQR